MNEKVKNALRLIESAQKLVGEATRELSSVDGYARPWWRVGKLYDHIKAEWYELEEFIPAKAEEGANV